MDNSAAQLIPTGFIFRKYIQDGSRGASLSSVDNYNQITAQALELVETLRFFKTNSPSERGDCGIGPRIGILISCYWPERYLKRFLDNLLSLENPSRLVPIFVNAGMEDISKSTILSILESGHFDEYAFMDKPGCTIYEAWNYGLAAFADKVDYFTNMNIDDLRHPLCLEVQAAVLDVFPEKQVAITDYLFFFEGDTDDKTLYESYIRRVAYTPLVNSRTLTFRNFPHSAPMWRSSVHGIHDIGFFDASSCSAGDADFWYRLSHIYPNAFFVISLPLNLYYFNPQGLSTSPKSKGSHEYEIYKKNHYLRLKAKMDEVGIFPNAKALRQAHPNNLLPLYLAIEELRANV
jgi:hypothetical protein